ncbi:MAG TPA: hypothetical protein VMV10_09605 [Pirellulales bacterium]|nr:hypothetical protein [Pirellulales bacterium]
MRRERFINKAETTPGAPIRRLEVAIDPDDAATIGFRAGRRSVTLFCMATFAELRDYTELRELTILARFAPGLHIECEDTGGAAGVLDRWQNRFFDAARAARLDALSKRMKWPATGGDRYVLPATEFKWAYSSI